MIKGEAGENEIEELEEARRPGRCFPYAGACQMRGAGMAYDGRDAG